MTGLTYKTQLSVIPKKLSHRQRYPETESQGMEVN